MYIFGLEVENFLVDKEGKVVVPPHSRDVPVDGFAGLVEFRSSPKEDIHACAGEIWAQRDKLSTVVKSTPDTTLDCAKFTAKQLIEIRRNEFAPNKDRRLIVRNLYNKQTRMLPAGKALASVQLNISNRLRPSYQYVNNGAISTVPENYGLLDIQAIVHSLDEEFAEDITVSGRQKGMYAIKDYVRLEYRSLPTSSFNGMFCRRVLKAIERIRA